MLIFIEGHLRRCYVLKFKFNFTTMWVEWFLFQMNRLRRFKLLSWKSVHVVAKMIARHHSALASFTVSILRVLHALGRFLFLLIEYQTALWRLLLCRNHYSCWVWFAPGFKYCKAWMIWFISMPSLSPPRTRRRISSQFWTRWKMWNQQKSSMKVCVNLWKLMFASRSYVKVSLHTFLI